MRNVKAVDADLREAAKAIVKYLGVELRQGEICIKHRTRGDDEATLIIAQAMATVGVTHVSREHVATTLLHVKSLAYEAYLEI